MTVGFEPTMLDYDWLIRYSVLYCRSRRSRLIYAVLRNDSKVIRRKLDKSPRTRLSQDTGQEALKRHSTAKKKNDSAIEPAAQYLRYRTQY